MAQVAMEEYLKLVPVLKLSPHKFLWSSCDAEADVLYVNFKKPSHATDSELTDEDVVIRYEGDEVIGLSILHASPTISSKPTENSWSATRNGSSTS